MGDDARTGQSVASPIENPMERPPKVLITKIGMDGHDRGSRLVAAFLRDSGMEVIYTGPWQKISDVVKIAEEEDVDVIGISSLASDHLLIPKLMDGLREAGLGHVGVVIGGTIPEDDEPWLVASGVEHVFHAGASLAGIVAALNELVPKVRSRSGTA